MQNFVIKKDFQGEKGGDDEQNINFICFIFFCNLFHSAIGFSLQNTRFYHLISPIPFYYHLLLLNTFDIRRAILHRCRKVDLCYFQIHFILATRFNIIVAKSTFVTFRYT